MLEPFFFLFLLIVFLAIGFVRDFYLKRRERSRAQWLESLRRTAPGTAIEDMIGDFGPPYETHRGDHRTLYEWKSPPATSLPKGKGLLILYAIANDAGIIDRVSWTVRGDTT